MKLKSLSGLTATILVILFFSSLALAAEPFIYPAKGQSQQQLEQDKAACYQWAVKQSGFDPMAPPTTTAPPPRQEQPEGGILRGAGVGALVGVAAGAIAGDAGKGAAIGAATGGIFGGIRRHRQETRNEAQQEQWAREQAAIYQKRRANYNRAFKACMEGKGYTLK
jgi:hypothetical protein